MTLELGVGVFVWLVGLCVGSFLNVVVYRLPRDISLNKPARSFCPKCGVRIAWYDNIPLLSWLVLRARCRACGAGISAQYPLVEGVTGLTFVLVYHLLFVAEARFGTQQPSHPADWPLLLAWLLLAAVLIACAAMDLVSYMVDVRIAYAAIVGGMVLYMFWPRATMCAPVTTTPIAAAAIVMLVASAVIPWLTAWREADKDEPETEAEAEPEAAQPSGTGAEVAGGWVAIAVFVGLAVWLLIDGGLHGAQGRQSGTLWPPEYVVVAALLAVFATTVLAGGQRRAADVEVSVAIQEEQAQARKVVLRELRWLAVPLAAGVATYVAVAYVPAIRTGWGAATQWSSGGAFCPLGGAAFAAFGAIIGAAAGWTLRVVFTLIFGREALGVGDIYILAAAGATGGWDIALLGLLLAVGIALAGYALSLLLKRTVIIPFGPWLAIGFITALWLNRPATAIGQQYYRDVVAAWSVRPDICLAAGGLMLVGSALAIVLARLARQLIEPSGK